MKFIFGFIIVFAVSNSSADLAADLAKALNQSTTDKQITKLKLQVDDKSVDAKWSTETPITLKENSDLFIDVAQIKEDDFIPEKAEEEIRDEIQEIAREIKESHSVAKESPAQPLVNAR